MRSCEKENVLTDAYMDESTFVALVNKHFAKTDRTAKYGVTDATMRTCETSVTAVESDNYSTRTTRTERKIRSQFDCNKFEIKYKQLFLFIFLS